MNLRFFGENHKNLLTFTTFRKMSRIVYIYRNNVKAGKTLCRGCILLYVRK